MARKQTQFMFSQLPEATIPRSSFNRSHSLKTAFDSGYLVPIFLDEVLPGDTFNLNATIFTRLSTLISPIMDNLWIDTHFFFVPERLVYNKFQRMCGEQENPDDSTDFIFPTINSGNSGFALNSIYDYFGLPINVPNLEVRAEPLRAYNLIYNEWYRDENLQDSVPRNMDEGYDSLNDYQLLRRGKRHDYFTSALPFPQKGPAVDLPISGNANLITSSDAYIRFNSLTVSNYFPGNDAGAHSGYATAKVPVTSVHPFNSNYPRDNGLDGNVTSGSSADYPIQRLSGVNVDLSDVGAVTINSLREAFQIQKWYERAARGGTRYVEILKSFFGVTSPDARLQRPEYLGGGSQPIQITSVPQTSSSDTTTPQANLGAYGIGLSSRNGFTKSFVEHGWIIGLCSVRADMTYQQGVNKMWLRSTKFDMYWPTFAHLGEQEVENREIYAQGASVKDAQQREIDRLAFGYQERYAEYRYHPSQITGILRSTAPQPLDNWHLAQKFESLPALNEDFIQENPPVDRILAVTNEPQFIADIYFDLKCARPMPVYSVPGLVDHF